MSDLDGISNANKTQAVNNTTAITGGSVQLTFALLLREIADGNKDAAMRKIQDIRDRQAESAKITETVNMLRNMKTGAGNDTEFDVGSFNSGKDAATEIADIQKHREYCKSQIEYLKSLPQNETNEEKLSKNLKGDDYDKFFDYKDKNNLNIGLSSDLLISLRDKYIGMFENTDGILEIRQNLLDASSKYGLELPSGKMKKEDIDLMIASLSAKQEEVTAGVQQEMVFVQDFMGQYSANTQGAVSAISQATQTATSVAKGG